MIQIQRERLFEILGINGHSSSSTTRSSDEPASCAPSRTPTSVCGSFVLCVETHEGWHEDKHYLNMALLAEQMKELMRLAA